MTCLFCEGSMDIVLLNPDGREAYHCPACRTIVEIRHGPTSDDDLREQVRQEYQDILRRENAELIAADARPAAGRRSEEGR